jgi:hypothetical protein
LESGKMLRPLQGAMDVMESSSAGWQVASIDLTVSQDVSDVSEQVLAMSSD